MSLKEEGGRKKEDLPKDEAAYPESWACCELGEITIAQYGKALPAAVRNETGSIPVVGSSGIVGRHDEALVNTPCIAIGRKGAAGAVHLIKGASWPIDTAYFIQPSEGVDIKYLSYWLSSRNLGALDKSTAIPSLSRDDLHRVSVPLAPAAEQARIVEKLEELLSDLDAGVAELKAAQQKLAQYRQSLLKAAVEGDLTADWRRQHTLTETGAELLSRILKERRTRWEAKQLEKFASQGKTPPKNWQNKYPEPTPPDTQNLPTLPEGWVWASAEQLCEFITKGTTPPKSIDSGKFLDIPFLRVTNLTSSGALNFSDKVFVSSETHRGFLARSMIFPDDVLMNIVGPPLGQVSLVPEDYPEWNMNQAIAVFRPISGLGARFLCSWLLSPTAINWFKARAKTTAGQTNLTLELCRAAPVPLPPEIEQQRIVKILDEAMAAAKENESAIELALKQTIAQRQNILRAAFAGELVPQDPSDEPASALLERIRAQRAAQAPAKKPRGRKKKEIQNV